VALFLQTRCIVILLVFSFQYMISISLLLLKWSMSWGWQFSSWLQLPSYKDFLPLCIECRAVYWGERCLSVCLSDLSVCLSVKHVYCDKTEEKSIQVFIPYERSFSLVFWEKEWLVGSTLSTWNFRSNWSIVLKRNRRFSFDIHSYHLSHNTLLKKLN